MFKMDYIYSDQINEDSKLVIGIGDSFCAGTGSEDIKLWEKNNWDVEKMRFDKDAIKNAYKNSFINKLCEVYLHGYLPVNLSMAGRGNRFAIRELFLNPTLNLEKAKEKIVIFVSSGLERFDFTDDISDETNHAVTAWPTYSDKKKIGYSSVTNVSGESIFNDRLNVSETMMDFFMLQNWCELNNAKLLFMSAFSPDLKRGNFVKKILNNKTSGYGKKVSSLLVNKLPWHRQIFPMNHDCIVHMLLHLEERDDLIPNYGFRDFKINTVSEHGYMSKCQHPTEKSQLILADIVYEHIVNYDNVVKPDYDYIDMQKYKVLRSII
jgi:hypothetical protein